MARIFISHASADNDATRRLESWLAAHGWTDVFVDWHPRKGIDGGRRWRRELKRAGRRCEAIICLVTAEWFRRPWCEREFNLADQQEKALFIVRLEDVETNGTFLDDAAELQMVHLFPGGNVGTAAEPEHGFCAHGLAKLKSGLRNAGLDARHFAWPPEGDDSRPPYRGLRSLDRADAAIFFGRSGQIEDALGDIGQLRDEQRSSIFTILGASGAGKSSFLRAGLLARLERIAEQYQVMPTMRPGHRILEGSGGFLTAITAFLAGETNLPNRAQIRDVLDQGPKAIVALIKSALRQVDHGSDGYSGHRCLIVPVDQGEELLLQVQNGDDAPDGDLEGIRFLDVLQALLTDDDLTVIVIVAQRTETFEFWQHLPKLGGIHNATMSLSPVEPGNFGEIILGPAQRSAQSGQPVRIAANLVSQLLNDLRDEQRSGDALPLLALTLERLYLDHQGREITLASYQQMGGLKRAIDISIDAVIGKALENNPDLTIDRIRSLLETAFVPWLATVDRLTRKPRRHVAREDRLPEEARPLINLLVEQRLLVRDRVDERAGGPAGDVEYRQYMTIEPAHEALLRRWDWLSGWLKDMADELVAIDELNEAAGDWHRQGRRPDWLQHKGERLDPLQAAVAHPALSDYPTEEARAYLAAAMAAQVERARRIENELARDARDLRTTRKGLILVTMVAALFAGSTFVAWQQWQLAEEHERAARTNEVKAVALGIRAKENENRAEKLAQQAIANRNVALAATRTLILDIVRDLRNVRGMRAGAGQEILDKALAGLNKLSAANPKVPELTEQLIEGYLQATETLLALGASQTAVSHARSAERLARLYNDQQSGQPARRKLARSLNWLGTVFLQTGEPRRALEAFGEAEKLTRALLEYEPDNHEWLRDLAIVLDRQGEARLRQGHSPAQATRLYIQSLEIKENLLSGAPDDRRARRDKSVSLNNIARVLEVTGHSKVARRYFEDSHDLRRQLLDELPDDSQA